jgi:hypothetical protein
MCVKLGKLLHVLGNCLNNGNEVNRAWVTCSEVISKVTTSTLELWLLIGEGINNHRLLHFLLFTASFHMHIKYSLPHDTT